MEKANVAAGGTFCGVRRHPKFFSIFTVLSDAALIFGRFYAVLPVTALN